MLDRAKGMAESEPGKPLIPAFSGTVRSKLAELAHRYIREAIEGVAVWRERRMIERELAELDDAALAGLGLVGGQIPIFVCAHPAAGNQLDRMLRHLGLESDEMPLDATMREDLYRVCVQCIERKRCRRWLVSVSAASKEELKTFCPNAWMFDMLRRRMAEAKISGRIAH